MTCRQTDEQTEGLAWRISNADEVKYNTQCSAVNMSYIETIVIVRAASAYIIIV